MKKKNIVKSNELFNSIINKGKRNANKYFVLCSEKNTNNELKFGIAVGKKVGNAVIRNKIKRQIRNIIDKNVRLFSNSNYYIIICKKEVLCLEFKDMENELVKLINKGENNEK